MRLPDNGGNFQPPANLENTITLATPDSYLVKISLVKDVKEGDYEQVITTLESIKRTEMDAETLIPWALNEGLGYKVEEITLTTKFREMKDLAGGVILNERQLASFRKMELAELDDITKLLGIGEETGEESQALIRLSSELVGREWQLINYQGALNKGMRAVIVIKKKIPEQIPSGDLVNNPYLQAPASWNRN